MLEGGGADVKTAKFFDLKDFSATNGRLKKRKLMYGIRQKINQGKSGDLPEETIDAWIEQICELIKAYKAQRIVMLCAI